ncbi:MAG: PAS domain S-box protein [Woeseiaceae bacterium]|nr:PAS domain S-box protein [Woeseiaceae bacterium]
MNWSDINMGENSLPADISKIGESDVFFRNLLESAPDAMIIVDDSGKMLLVNKQAMRMFGYERDEMIGQKIELLLPGPIRDRHIGHRTSYVEAPRLRPMGQDINLIGLRKDGSEVPVEISLSPIKTDSGRYISSVIRDVSVRRQMEQDLNAAREAAERANKANSAFLAAASHDLRQPVQALSLLNGALRRTVKDEKALLMVQHQDASLTAMTNLLNSLLDISRLDAGAIVPEWEDFPMQRVIDRLSAEFGRQAHQKGLAFSSESCDAIVRSDPNLLAEVVTNLVSNAIRYTDSGEVRMVCKERDGYCHLEVSDTGVGIEADQLDAIFREFHQCKSPGASKEGFGLGLAIVRRLTDLLDHRIDVESDPGKGSRFTVAVPIIADIASYVDDESAEDAELVGRGSGLIILIEDDVSVANAWGLLLEAEGYTVATAASAQEAKALIHHVTEPPVLLISDFHLLDGSTGVQTVSLIREHYQSDIPAFIVSGDTSKVVKDSRLIDNCTLMSKPVDTARLLAAAQYASRSGCVPLD